MSSQRGRGTVVKTLTVRLLPVQRGADVGRERSEHDSPPTISPRTIGSSLVGRTKNRSDRSVDIRRKPIRCRSKEVRKTRNLKAYGDVVWDDLRSLVSHKIIIQRLNHPPKANQPTTTSIFATTNATEPASWVSVFADPRSFPAQSRVCRTEPASSQGRAGRTCLPEVSNTGTRRVACPV